MPHHSIAGQPRDWTVATRWYRAEAAPLHVVFLLCCLLTAEPLSVGAITLFILNKDINILQKIPMWLRQLLGLQTVDILLLEVIVHLSE